MSRFWPTETFWSISTLLRVMMPAAGATILRIAQVELGLVELGLRLLHLRFGLAGVGVLRGHLLRPGLGVLQQGLRLRLALAGDAHTVGGSLLAGARIGQRGLVRVGGGHGRVKLLLADHILLHQRPVAVKIGLRLGGVGLGLRHPRLRGLQLLLGLLHCGMRAAHIGVRRTQIAARVDGGDGHIHLRRGRVGLCTGQSGLRILHRNLEIRGDRVRRSRRRHSPTGSLPHPP